MTISVSIRTADGNICRIRSGKDLQEVAMDWKYRIRNRNRWATSAEARANVAQQAADSLKSLGLTPQHLRSIASADLVEVSIPFKSEEDGWEARILPWEYMLTAATKSLRQGCNLVVVRRLTGGRAASRTPESMSIVEAAPNALSRHRSFEVERNLIRGSMMDVESHVIKNPTRAGLKVSLAHNPPDVIHVTGIDSDLGAQLLNLNQKKIHDGLCLAHDRKQLDMVGAEPLAELLNTGDPNPLLVGFNCQESGARLAPMAIHHGASAALGIQNWFDETAAQTFFYNFYKTWSENGWNLINAFTSAWSAISEYHEKLRGTGIILWTAGSVLGEAKKPIPPPTKVKKRFADPKRDDIRQLVKVDVQPISQINYGLLHNGRSIFEKFHISFVSEVAANAGGQPIGTVGNLEIEAMLHVGSDSFPFRTMAQVSDDAGLLDLTDQIHLSLVSEFARSVTASIQTNLFVQVRCADQLIYQHTFTVRLTPVNEWKLHNLDIWWLPSFVQSGDPAVAKIIDSAQRYLMAITDDTSAGFDGYQSADIDPQVRAIWTAIVLDFQLSYVNPPPSFTEDGQCLRTPSQIVNQGRGTCVDLAILMSACLEWVEIYPVIFMLDHHAFPGYWATEEAHTKYCEGGEGRMNQDRTAMSAAWISGRGDYAELKKYIDDRSLAPLETVNLTARTSFDKGWSDSYEDHFCKATNKEFHSMIDIASARPTVSALPMFNMQ